MAERTLRAVEVTRTYASGTTAVHGCRDVSVEVGAGELLLITGPSGSGKTTLLNLLGGLDWPTSGRVFLDEAELSAMAENQLVYIRRRRVGYVFTSFGLVPILSAAENVEVPLRLLGTRPKVRAARVAELLAMVGLSEHAAHRPSELSGGQQQRVAIARALATEPEVLIADEPTRLLDPGTGQAIMDLIRELVHERGMTAVVAAADPLISASADTVVELRDGWLVEPAIA